MNSLSLRQKLVDIARSQIGVTEVGYSNTGAMVEEYQRATNLEGTGWPWCAAFQCWCIREWLKDPEVMEALKLTFATVDDWRPKTAAAWGFEDWGRKKGLIVTPQADCPNFELHTGDIVTFRYSHVELVETDHADSLFSVGGNTNDGLDRDGGAVCEHWHPRVTARSFIRLLP